MTVMKKVKILIDVLMTLLLFAVMAYPITGEMIHKQLGAGMFVLFFLHHLLNWRWYRAITKGKYSAVRWVHFINNTLLLISMIGLMVSGFLLSSWAYHLNIHAGAFGRKLHMMSASWGYLLMSAHIGLHWGVLAGGMKKKEKAVENNLRDILRQGLAAVIVAYGVYEAFVRQFFHKMLWMVDYAFYDFSEPAVFFFVDYFFIMVAIGGLTYYLTKIRKNDSKKL